MDFRKILYYAEENYIQWIFNPRMIIILVFGVFINSFIIDPLMEAGIEMGCQISILEPLVALGTSSLILLIIPLVFLTLMADFPKTDENGILYIIRIGRINWLLGQLLFLLWSILTFFAFLAVCCIGFTASRANWTLEWSKVATHYVVYFPERIDSFVNNLLPNNLYNQMNLLLACFHTYLLMLLYLLILCMVLMVMSLMEKRWLGVLIDGIIIALGAALCAAKTEFMWLFPMANATIWMHYDSYYRAPVKSVLNSYLYFIVIFVVLFVVSNKKIQKYNYYVMSE